MSKRSTKSALLTSSIALLLCFTMLLGTTFAWFTDSVTSANNIIKSGNLDATFEYWNGTEWETVQNSSEVLTNELWEPGVTEVAYLRVSNAGSLALKYELGINIVSETEGTNVANETFKLSDYLYFGVIEDAQENAYANRAEAVAAVTNAQLISAGYTKASTIEAGSSDNYFALVVYMPETVTNDANHNGTDVPEIELGLNVYAAQMASEDDSFGIDYDANAKSDKPAPTVKVADVAELTAALANITEETVIDATGVVVDIDEIPDGKNATFYDIPAGVTIKGATINPTYRGGNYVMYTAGAGETVVFEDCLFTNTKNLVLGSEAGGPDLVIYNNCKFEGYVITNFVDNLDGVAEFNNCTFTKNSNRQNFVEGMGGTHNFNNCTFDYTGVTQSSMGVITNGQINVYSEAEYSTVVNLTGCTLKNCGRRTHGPNSTLTIK